MLFPVLLVLRCFSSFLIKGSSVYSILVAIPQSARCKFQNVFSQMCSSWNLDASIGFEVVADV